MNTIKTEAGPGIQMILPGGEGVHISERRLTVFGEEKDYCETWNFLFLSPRGELKAAPPKDRLVDRGITK